MEGNRRVAVVKCCARRDFSLNRDGDMDFSEVISNHPSWMDLDFLDGDPWGAFGSFSCGKRGGRCPW